VTTTTVTLDWSYAGCTPVQFEWQLGVDDTFGPDGLVQFGDKDWPDTEVDVPLCDQGLADRLIYWRVRVSSSGAWSPVRRFLFDPPPRC
jgi:hypothetical protein